MHREVSPEEQDTIDFEAKKFNWPKISPNLFFCSMKMSLYIMTLHIYISLMFTFLLCTNTRNAIYEMSQSNNLLIYDVIYIQSQPKTVELIHKTDKAEDYLHLKCLR